MIAALFNILELLLTVLWWIIIIQVVLSWLFAFNVLNTGSGAVRSITVALDRLTAPLYRPIRRILPDFGALAAVLALSLLLMALGYRYFRNAAESFLEEI